MKEKDDALLNLGSTVNDLANFDASELYKHKYERKNLIYIVNKKVSNIEKEINELRKEIKELNKKLDDLKK